MPTYNYRCKKCGAAGIRVCSMKNHVNTMPCDCGNVMQQIIDVPYVVIPEHMQASFNGYKSPIDDRPITSMRQRAEDMARNGCIEYEPGMRQDADRRAKESEEKLEKNIEQSVEKAISEMPAIKKEKLSAEISRGIDTNITRA